jgi:hypothetical protein
MSFGSCGNGAGGSGEESVGRVEVTGLSSSYSPRSYLFIGWGRCQIFGYGLWVEKVVIITRMVSHCTGSYARAHIECTVGMSVCRQGGNSKNLIIQGL